jgi:hypothetical protein
VVFDDGVEVGALGFAVGAGVGVFGAEVGPEVGGVLGLFFGF